MWSRPKVTPGTPPPWMRASLALPYVLGVSPPCAWAPTRLSKPQLMDDCLTHDSRPGRAVCTLGSLYSAGFLLPTVSAQLLLAPAKLNLWRRQWIPGTTNLSYLREREQRKWLFSHETHTTLSGADFVIPFLLHQTVGLHKHSRRGCGMGVTRNIRPRTKEMR